MSCHAPGAHQFSCEELRAAVPEGPILVRVGDHRHDHVGWCQTACRFQLADQHLVEILLCLPLMRPSRDLDNDTVACPCDAESCVFHDEVRGWMLVNDLVSITLRNLEGRDHNAMGGVQQRLDLVRVAALNHVKAKEWHRHLPPVGCSAVSL